MESKWKYIRLSIEVVALFYYFLVTLGQVSSGLMYQVKICLFEIIETLGKNDTSFWIKIEMDKDNCFHLQEPKFKDALDIVAKKQSDVTSVGLALQIIPNAIASLILVNAADLIGRKHILLIVFSGYIIHSISFIVNWYYVEVSYWWMLMECWHQLFGGRAVLTVALMLYVSDVTPDKWKSIRFNCLSLIELSSTAFAVIASGWILDPEIMSNHGEDMDGDGFGDDFYGFYTVYGVALILNVLAIVWTIFVLKETNSSSEKLTLKKVFNPTKMTESFKCMIKRRENGSTWIILSLMVMYYIVCVQYDGLYLSPSLFLYFEGLGWSYSQFTTLFGINGVMIMIGILTIIPFLILKLHWTDMTIGFWGCFFYAGSAFVFIISPYGNEYIPYIAVVCNMFSGACLPMVKSSLTKIIPKEELPSLFAVVGMLQALSAIGAPISNIIYSASINWCNTEEEEKDWCSTTFIWTGFIALFVNCVLFIFTRLGIKSKNLINHSS